MIYGRGAGFSGEGVIYVDCSWWDIDSGLRKRRKSVSRDVKDFTVM